MKKRLMIVDDSIFAYEEMKYMLKDSEYEIVGYAKTGEEGVDLYFELMPDLVTMDIILPGIDGLEAAEQIITRHKEAKILMVSSLAYDETIDKAEEIGAKGFIFKPFEHEQLLEDLDKGFQS